MVTIKSTKIYERDIKRLLSQHEREHMENALASDPLYWPVIRQTGGVRKARFARHGRGKSAGGRVCYLYVHIYDTIYMLKAYAKNQSDNLSDQEKTQIKKHVDLILQTLGEKHD